MRAIHSYDSIPRSLRSNNSKASATRSVRLDQQQSTLPVDSPGSSNSTSSRVFSIAGLLVAACFLASAAALLANSSNGGSASSLIGTNTGHQQNYYQPPSSGAGVQMLGKAKTIMSATTSSSSWSTLSNRGQSIHPVRHDIELFMKAAADPYHPVNNTGGYLVMLVAENRLMYDELADKLEQVVATTKPPEWSFDYGDMTGQADFKRAIADMMESSWVQAPVADDASLTIQAGAGSVLDSLSWILADAGDAVLTMGPAYAAFDADFGLKGQVNLHVAPTSASNNYEPTLEDLERVYQEALQAGQSPRILVICQPNNPTGAVYSAAAMRRMIFWALSKDNMHVVSDEIYGNSVFPGVHVTSAAQIMYEEYNDERGGADDANTTYLGDRVHIVAGMSKDWGMSGFRVGSLLTHNSALQQALSISSYYVSASQYTQWTLTSMLQDTVWRDWYLAENKRRLEATFRALQEALALIDVRVYEHTEGALFAWADFSGLLQEGQTEQEMWMELFEDAKILFTLGESFYGDKPGMFRVVYPWPKGGIVAMQELGRRLVQWKNARTV